MKKPCPINKHDLDNPKKIGRAHWECRKCGADISIIVFLAWQGGYYEKEREEINGKEKP